MFVFLLLFVVVVVYTLFVGRRKWLDGGTPVSCDILFSLCFLSYQKQISVPLRWLRLVKRKTRAPSLQILARY